MSSVTRPARRGSSGPAVLIIADDLSGAADSAVACAERGLKTVVALSESAETGAAEALALDADTRRSTSDAAAAATARLVRSHTRADAGLLFKKIDSTLRGHIAWEVKAFLDTRRQMASALRARRTIAIVAAAFPALGRTTRAGRQHLDGVPLEQTELWRREGLTGSASLLEMMQAADLASKLVPIKTVRSGERAVRAAMTGAIEDADVLVCDAETDADLAVLASASSEIGCDVVWVGAAGLVGHLLDAAGLTRKQSNCVGATPVAGPLLFVVGSLSPESRRQAARLASEDVAVLTIEGFMLDEALSLADFAHRLDAAFAAGKDALVLSATVATRGGAAAWRAAMSDLIAPCATCLGGLFATGGATARAVLTGLGVTGLRVVADVEHGVPLSVAIGPRAFPVVTKAGAFGNVATMVECRRALRQWNSVAFSTAPAIGART